MSNADRVYAKKILDMMDDAISAGEAQKRRADKLQATLSALTEAGDKVVGAVKAAEEHGKKAICWCYSAPEWEGEVEVCPMCKARGAWTAARGRE